MNLHVTGQFVLANKVPNLHSMWHINAEDYTLFDWNGYMMIIDVATTDDSVLFKSTVDSLCIGERYEFSAYLANIVKKEVNAPKPNIRFEVREAAGRNKILNQLNTGDLCEKTWMTWSKHILSFVASTSSVVLSIVPEDHGVHGRDLAIDNIELRVCSIFSSGFCPSGQTTTAQKRISTIAGQITTAEPTLTTTVQLTSTTVSSSISSTTDERVFPTTMHTISKIVTTTTKQDSTTALSTYISHITSTNIPSVKELTSMISLFISTTLSTTTIPKKDSKVPFVPKNCDNSSYIGTYCNISNEPCRTKNPCENNSSCTNNNTIPDGYICVCPRGCSGVHCEVNLRRCASYICLNNGMCNDSRDAPLSCICSNGWQGVHCESMINYCERDKITCSKNGVCRPLLLGYKCECFGTSYSGRDCEIVTAKIRIIKILSKSLSYVSILIIISFILFIIIMDILKYCFGIDPVRDDLERYRREKRTQNRKHPVIQRFVYVNKPSELSKTTDTTA
ncbi:hypothetical protein I4U23_003592 [Adineta vaga]|nr:hypothetical protein I4U23_003592 [Adineta vaga]